MSQPFLTPGLKWLAVVGFFGALAGGAVATTVIAPDFAQLVNESDYVIRGVVKSVTSEFRPMPTGNRQKIITKVEIEVREVVAGQPPDKVVLEILGGKIGDQEMVLEGAPKFNVGDEDILFVSGNGQSICPLFAMMHGRYPIQREAATGRQYVTRSNRVPLQDPSEVALPMSEGSAAEMQRKMKNTAQALTPEQFAQRVKAAVNPSYVRAQPN